MAPKQGKSAQNSAAQTSQAASKNAKGAKKKKWSKGKVCFFFFADQPLGASELGFTRTPYLLALHYGYAFHWIAANGQS